jgi:hypothetical protein
MGRRWVNSLSMPLTAQVALAVTGVIGCMSATVIEEERGPGLSVNRLTTHHRDAFRSVRGVVPSPVASRTQNGEVNVLAHWYANRAQFYGVSSSAMNRRAFGDFGGIVTVGTPQRMR